ncbi:4Fe-4S ferredoxin [Prauserella marina]|uniref:Glycolate oxidase iron-sulfur subunit n=1 Tax=Prauserella marina TaxID=530584 RepID=A0A222VUG9_9PSEU|nr:(Fe-S)-binding protein [Prauserella marina]ASR37371.1 4Fe-4S ferredoxin [Prauserella marina]PWV74764.1 glycolate oxidase iron-sulfur subunit [Prauserella marina]SDD41307.1 glycolate oxidase iron-sulfur subunit [Prauserella marina]
MSGVFDAEKLGRCISCGFCLPACPTYALTGDEAASPRGRITLMRALEEGRLDVTDPASLEQSSFCLGCRACEPVCPAGVEYGTLLEQWRDHQWQGAARPVLARWLMALVSRAWLLRLQGLVRGHARGKGEPRGAALLLGCVERGLYPEVSRAARELRGELAAPSGQGCCGALHAHNGDSRTGGAMAALVGARLPGVIVTTAGGCAAHLAAHLGRERVKEFSEYLAEHEVVPSGEVRVAGRRARVALQDSCHLRNALGVFAEPRALIGAVADYVELPGAAGCCGAAGTYSLLRKRDSMRVLAPKLDAIAEAEVDFVVAVNPGCLRQLRQGLKSRGSTVRAIHLAELLAMAQRDWTLSKRKGDA